MPTAILFPGQASQTPDMRDAVAAVRPDLLERVCELVGEDPFARVDDGTQYAQPAIFCASLAGLAAADEETPDAVAGHSLGELTALVAAGALEEEDGLALVVERGRLMERAGRRSGTGGMLAVLGGQDGEAAALARAPEVVVANDNAPGQLVLSGDRQVLEQVAVDARAAGLKAMALGVAGAFHSPYMGPAADAFADAVAITAFREPRVPVYSCVTAAPLDDPRRRLVEGLTSPVRWRETLLALRAAGIDRYVETGPGKVLTRLVGRTLEGVEASTVKVERGAHV